MKRWNEMNIHCLLPVISYFTRLVIVKSTFTYLMIKTVRKATDKVASREAPPRGRSLRQPRPHAERVGART